MLADQNDEDQSSVQEDAVLLFQRNLRIKEKQLKTERHLLAEPLQGLAQIYTEQEKYEQAGPLYQRALILRQQTLGPEHPSVAETLHHLARFHQLQQQTTEALASYRRALILFEQTFGLAHPKTTQTRAVYEALLQEMGCVEGTEAALSAMPGTFEQEPL